MMNGVSLPRAIEPYGDEANNNVDDKTECDVGQRASFRVDDGYHNLGHEHPD